MMPLPPDKFKDLGATVPGEYQQEETFDFDEYTLESIPSAPKSAEFLSSIPIHKISGIQTINITSDAEILNNLLKVYEFPELKDSISNYKGNTNNPVLFLEMLENMYRLLLTAEFYKNTSIPTRLIASLRKKVQYNHALVSNIFMVERPEVYQNMEFGLTNLELGDAKFAELLVRRIGPVQTLRQQKIAQINELLGIADIVAQHENRQ